MKINDRFVCDVAVVEVEQVDRVRGVVWYKFLSTGAIRAERIKAFLFNYRPLTLETVLEQHKHRLPPDVVVELEGLIR